MHVKPIDIRPFKSLCIQFAHKSGLKMNDLSFGNLMKENLQNVCLTRKLSLLEPGNINLEMLCKKEEDKTRKIKKST